MIELLLASVLMVIVFYYGITSKSKSKCDCGSHTDFTELTITDRMLNKTNEYYCNRCGTIHKPIIYKGATASVNPILRKYFRKKMFDKLNFWRKND